MLVLGIETSCDETAVALVEDGLRVRANVIGTQLEQHRPYGGVVPEIAARAHVEALDGVIEAALMEAGVTLDEVDAIAATAGPGLIGGLIVGVTMAKAIAAAKNKPFLPINHLEGHALTARLTDHVDFPFLLLLVSGGHTQILHVAGLGKYERWGTTIDDALGEAFDKTAKLLDLPYPGGPAVERAAADGDAKRFALPRPLLDRPGLDMSFAGLKTAVRNAAYEAAPLSERDVADLCASFQEAVADVIGEKARRALAAFSAAFPAAEPVLVIAGGVAANAAIRDRLDTIARGGRARLVAPSPSLCTDNAAMIAWAAIERLRLGPVDDSDVSPRPRWPLDTKTAGVLGAGKKGAKA